MIPINLNKLISILQSVQNKCGDIPVYIGLDHGSDIYSFTINDCDLVENQEDGKNYLIIGKDCSRE